MGRGHSFELFVDHPLDETALSSQTNARRMREQHIIAEIGALERCGDRTFWNAAECFPESKDVVHNLQHSV